LFGYNNNDIDWGIGYNICDICGCRRRGSTRST
jgi:hypothetical protein